MKIAILTFHNSDNYGSVLQAYALRTFIKKNCQPERCDIINYIPPNQEALYAIYLKNNSLKNVLKNIRAFCHSGLLKRRKAAFEEFRKSKLEIDSVKMYSPSDVDRKLEDYDVLICGSDQIWNPISLDFSEVYFGTNFSKKKIAYAPSFGNGTADSFKGDVSWVKESIERFHALSVRESAGKALLSQIGVKKNVEEVLDPTFLLKKSEWEEIMSAPSSNEEYIFFYSIDYREEAIENARAIAKKVGLPIKVIFSTNKTYRTIGKGIQLVDEVSPADFLSLIKNAKIVLSSSFHGVAFSLIFRKNFYALESYRNGVKYEDERIHTILGKLNLSDRIVSIDNINTIHFDTNNIPSFDEALIENEIEASRKYVTGNIL